MEVKINKEIRNYTESIYFGLSLRQFICSIFSIIVAVILYFCLRDSFGIETLSWVCILGAAPFACIGFIRYQGMTAEQLLLEWIQSEFILVKHLDCYFVNLYEVAYQGWKKTTRKKRTVHNDKNTSKSIKRR